MVSLAQVWQAFLDQVGLLTAICYEAGSGGFAEFELAIQVVGYDGWGSGGQAVEEDDGRARRRWRPRSLHLTRAGADGDAVVKNSGQEPGPGNAVASAATGRLVLTAFGLRSRLLATGG